MWKWVLNRQSKIYVSVITLAGMLFILYSLFYMDYALIGEVLLLGVLSALVESSPIYISEHVTLSVAFAIDLMAVLLLGPFNGSIVTVLGYIFKISKTEQNKYIHILNRPFTKSVFNISQIALSSGMGGIAFLLTGGIPGKQIIPNYILPAIIGALTYYILNSLIISFIISSINNKPFSSVWNKDFKWAIKEMFFLIFLGIIMTSVFVMYGYVSLAFFLIPLFMVYHTFKLYMDSKKSYHETIGVLIKALEAKDRYTAGHSRSVEKIAVLLCRELDFSPYITEKMRIAALLHDLGKIGIPEIILNKPGKLTEDEFDIIKNHSQYGYEILKDVSELRDISTWIRYHHEHYDGTGYPDGIKGEQIPMESQILSLADVFDALISDRPYRRAFTKDEAYNIIVANSGKQFSPKIVDVFKSAYRKHKGEFTHDF